MTSSIPTSFSVDEQEEGGVWELRHDEDGFTYKILKKLKFSDPATSPDPKAEAKLRRERKRKILLKLKSEYQKEMESWELLSNRLCEMEERGKQNVELRKVNETASSSVVEVENDVEGCGLSLIDELLWKAEAQEAIIRDVSNLCDVAEAICDTREQQLAQSFIDLPIWSSPRTLMASLCDSDE